MTELKVIGADECTGLTPRMFVVNHAAGEKVDKRVQVWKDPIDVASFHCWMLEKEKATKLHYHDYDEYWAWVKGRTLVTIRLPDGRKDTFEIGPGWIVHCVRGIEHGHEPLEDWGCFEWTSMPHESAQKGHLFREI